VKLGDTGLEPVHRVCAADDFGKTILVDAGVSGPFVMLAYYCQIYLTAPA
jgi:hypothetical protein